MKKTHWFPAREKPSRVGWYEVSCRHGMYGKGGERLFWDAYLWRLDSRKGRETSFGFSCDRWRGLSEKPE